MDASQHPGTSPGWPFIGRLSGLELRRLENARQRHREDLRKVHPVSKMSILFYGMIPSPGNGVPGRVLHVCHPLARWP
jgi:hypothetical protein